MTYRYTDRLVELWRIRRPGRTTRYATTWPEATAIADAHGPTARLDQSNGRGLWVTIIR